MSTISIDGLSISVPSILLPDGSMSAPTELDLSTYTQRYHETADISKIVRLYMMVDGSLALDPPGGETWWLLAEVGLPAPEYDIEVVPAAPIVTTREISVQRDGASTDVVPLSENESIGRVGFSWAPYVSPRDYLVSGATIAWVAGPESGEQYIVEIITTTTAETEIRTPLPVNMSAATIILYNLPGA